MKELEIAYTVKGQGRPLILLHGNGEDHTIFREAAELLSQYYTVYMPDSRSHGRSTKVKELHYRDMADDMVRFMGKLKLSDVIFCGFSDGGIIGLIAAARTNRITELITCGANVTPEGVQDWLRKVFQRVYAFTRDPKLRLMLEEPDITDDELRKITARTLVLAGSKDLVKESETRHIAETIPDAELKILEGESHTSYTVHSTKLAREIMEFIGVLI